MTITQTHRIAKLRCSLAADVLLVDSVLANEVLSGLFEISLNLASTSPTQVHSSKVLGHAMGIEIDLGNGFKRHFHGLVTDFGFTGQQNLSVSFSATLRPWFWLLTQNTNCRIYQNKSVPEIVKSIVQQCQGADFAIELIERYPSREYCVQYNESDFDFISRLLEAEGIYYYFKHEFNRHILVLTDNHQSHKQAAGYGEMLYRPNSNLGAAAQEVITSWHTKHTLQAGESSLRAFNFEKPTPSNQGDLMVRARFSGPEKTSSKYYSFSDSYVDRENGERYAKNQTKIWKSNSQKSLATASTCGLQVGCTFKMKGHSIHSEQQALLVTQIQTIISGGIHGPFSMESSFTAIPNENGFKSEKLTPIPRMQGPQTAMVVGKAGEEIWTDKHGRVKLQFHWDLDRPENEKSSCWVRVAQMSAGKKWGALFTPRIGQEVLVDFLNGDPDHPLVIGAVYNANTQPPYNLPDQATRSTIKTQSSKGGGGYNELRFEDKKDKEHIFIKAQKDLDLRITNDTKETIGKDNHSLVKGSRFQKTDQKLHVQVGLDKLEKVNGKSSMTVAQGVDHKSQSHYVIDAGSQVHIKAGATLVIEAGIQLTLKVGGSYLVLDPVQIAINAPLVKINSGGNPGSGQGVNASSPDSPKEALKD